MTVYQNPKYYKGPTLERSKVRIKDSVTYQAGTPCRRTDSGVAPCKSAATSFQGFFARTRATATSSTDDYVDFIPSENTQFIFGVTKANADTKALTSYIGGNYGLAVNSCVGTLSTGADTSGVEILNVKDILPNVEGFKNDTSDVPGFVIASVIASALTTEGTGQ